MTATATFTSTLLLDPGTEAVEMIDPFPAPPQWSTDIIRPLAARLGLQTLPLHLHEVLAAFVFYLWLDGYVSPSLSSWLFPQTYSRLSRRTRINWDVHAVSFIQSLIICGAAFWVIWTDEERGQLDARGRILGYNGATGMTQALAAGYFMWDVVVSSQHLSILGPGSLAHAASALLIVNLGFRPFANYYGVAFVLYELSTPFLNIHWFLDKCNMTGSRFQLYNGAMLILVFFGCRLVWGPYMSWKIYQDIWSLQVSTLEGAKERGILATVYGILSTGGLHSAGQHSTGTLPWWLVFVYLGSNTLLTFLNFYWFTQMIQALMKRFPEKPRGGSKAKANGTKKHD